MKVLETLFFFFFPAANLMGKFALIYIEGLHILV